MLVRPNSHIPEPPTAGMDLFWHRRDLRTTDNVGLAAATEPAVPVYILDPTTADDFGDRQRAFVVAGLESLADQYRELGSQLLIREGRAEDVLRALLEEYDADSVHCNACYTPARRAQADRVQATVPLERHTDLVLVDPATLEASYPTHSQFYNDWEVAQKPEPVAEPTASQLVSADSIDAESELERIRTAIEIEPEIELPPTGSEAAQERLERFCERGIKRYNERRDDLTAAVERATEAVSRLSPYIATGMVGIRTVWETAGDALQDAVGAETKNVEKYRYELSWREHNYHLLATMPTLATENYNKPPNPIAWETDDEQFEAWKHGETGYPLVDAGMRQLAEEGYIHNRPRQVVASFLCKHLLIDWRKGEQWFKTQLLDYDPAVNAGNWQWIASTGTDSVAVRIFDPVAQMAKYDRNATFVTQYVPELEGVPAESILEWPTLSPAKREQIESTYPEPIVDRNPAYERAQQTFDRAFGIDR